MKERYKRKKGRKRGGWFGRILLLLFVLLAADYFLYPKLTPVGGRSFNKGTNASWLHYSWYFGESNEWPTELVAELKQHQIRTAYFHTRFIKKDGALRYRNAAPAKQLTSEMHKLAPNIKSVAWVYVGNERGLTGVDISNKTVRARMVKEALWLVNECGFDGVQWDYEICENGNPNLLALLRETRQALPKGKLLSIATPMWLPAPLGSWGWSEDYFAKIAASCDQIAVMGYDSGLYWPRHYVWLMKQQAIRVTRATASGNPKCRVLIGIPTYEDGGPSHHLYSENIGMALRGVREGLADPAAKPAVFEGTAIFADYSTDEREWGTYKALWLDR